jgi:uncharacterized protein
MLEERTMNIAVVDVNSAHLMADKNLPFILVVHKGENLHEAIKKCAVAAKIQSAALTGLGALTNVKLGYFNLETLQYQYKIFPEMYELIALTGNITRLNNEYIAHLHVALGDSNYNTISGHLDSAIVTVTVEVTVIPLNAPIMRQLDPDFKLNLIKAN